MRNLVHGTNNGYVNLGCRCPECRTAASAYMKAWRSSRQIPCPDCGRPKDRYRSERCKDCHQRHRAAQHGTVSRYARGCKCNACRAASAAAKREWRARTGKP